MGANPTEAEVQTMWKNAVALLDNYLTGQTIPANQNTYVESIESDFAAEMTAGAALFRSRAASAAGSGAAVLDPVLVTYAHHIVDTPERASQAVIDRLYKWFLDNTITIKSRGINYGAIIPGGGNNGNGNLYRLTVDENAYDLENIFIDANGKTVTCISDAQSGAERHEEIFEIRGTRASLDTLEVPQSGSGLVRRDFQAFSSNQSLLSNPTFSQFTVSGAGPVVGTPYTLVSGDVITDWAASDVTDLQLNVDLWYRDVVGDTTPTSLWFLDNASIEQAFDLAPIEVNPDTPYQIELAVYREGNADGTLTLSWGNKSQAFAVSSLNNGAWNAIAIDRDQDLWPVRFNENNATIKVEWTGRTTGTLGLDEDILAPMQSFDGTWWMSTGGTVLWLIDDVLTILDALAALDSKIQKHLWRAYGRYLPHSATPSFTDPT